MKKTALSFSLLLALVAGTMVGCNDVKSKKENGKEVLYSVGQETVYADDLLGLDEEKLSYDFLKTDEGVGTVYGIIYDSIAQKFVKDTSTILAAVDEKMEDFEDEVEEHASAEGVTTNTAEKELLAQLGVEDKDELRALYLVEEKKKELETMYNNVAMEPETTGDNAFKGTTMVEKYVANTAPMITKHILVKFADSNTLYNLAEVSKEEVEKATSVMQRLALGKAPRNVFKNIAVEESEDGSATKGGNLGIMDTYTSFVNEYKLGLYVNELIQNHNNADYDKNNALHAEDYEEELFGAEGVYANYEVKKVNIATIASVLAYVADDEAKSEQKANGHEKTSEYDADLYPRNIIYNKYFNYPGIQYLEFDTTNAEADIKALVKEVYPHLADADVDTKVAAILDSDFYKAFAKTEDLNINADKLVLDDKENPIVLAKSEYGFHFLSVSWSALDQVETEAIKYFMYNKTTDIATNYAKDTAFDFGYTTVTVGQNARKTEIKDRVLNYVKGGFATVATSENLYQFDIYDYYMQQTGAPVIKSQKVIEAVNTYKMNNRDIKQAAIEDAFDEAWENYIAAIEACNEIHAEIYK